MEYNCIEQLDATGLARTVMTTEGSGNWFSNEAEGHAAYRALAEHFGLNADTDLAGTFQRHTAIVKAVTRADAGRNILWRDPEPESVDGIVTDEPGLMLCSIESDCTPVFLLDPVRKAIGMVHSGWKGTAGQIAVKAVRLMAESYGTDPAELLVAFGPCICRDCYEVGPDLIPPFEEAYTAQERERFFRPEPGMPGKLLLDVNEAIRISLLREGVYADRIYDCGECTFHGGRYYSHRRMVRDGLPTRSNMLTGIMLL